MNDKMLSCFEKVDQDRNNLAKEYGCSLECATVVLYLRTRDQWTPELEKQFIKTHASAKEISNFLSLALLRRLIKTLSNSEKIAA